MRLLSPFTSSASNRFGQADCGVAGRGLKSARQALERNQTATMRRGAWMGRVFWAWCVHCPLCKRRAKHSSVECSFCRDDRSGVAVKNSRGAETRTAFVAARRAEEARLEGLTEAREVPQRPVSYPTIAMDPSLDANDFVQVRAELELLSARFSGLGKGAAAPSRSPPRLGAKDGRVH